MRNYIFLKDDAVEAGFIGRLFSEHKKFDTVVHLLDESHVDRYISYPLPFVHTNLVGTVNLLHAAKKHWHGERNG